MTKLDRKTLKKVPDSQSDTGVTFYDIERSFGDCKCKCWGDCEHQRTADFLASMGLIEFIGLVDGAMLYRRTPKGDKALAN